MNAEIATKKGLAFRDINDMSCSSNRLAKKMASVVRSEAFGDKENVKRNHGSCLDRGPLKPKAMTDTKTTTAVQISKTNDNSEFKHDHKKEVEHKNIEQLPDVSHNKKITLIAEDLTSIEPTANYWKAMAQKRCEALREALNENEYLRKKLELTENSNRSEKEEYLRKKVDLLEKENNTLKSALSQATEAIEIFKEMLAENEIDNGKDEGNEDENPTPTRTMQVSKNKHEDDAFGNDSINIDEGELTDSD